MNFLEQFQRLRESVPHPAILTVRSENSDYCPYMANGKNSYLMIGHNQNEDCFYGYWVGFSEDCVDSAFMEKSKFCYECVSCRECYGCTFCQDCLNVTDCDFCSDCRSCEYCFLSVNLRHKRFYILNKPYSKEEYFAKVAELKKLSREELFKMLQDLRLQEPRLYLQGFNYEDSTGDHIFWSKGAQYCFDVNELEDCSYMTNASLCRDCCDVNYTSLSELNYFCHSAVALYNSNFCDVCWYSQNLEYCEYVFNSHDCFGCVSLNHAAYRILNVQYEPEEYKKRVAAIKREILEQGIYGKFFESNYPELMPKPNMCL